MNERDAKRLANMPQFDCHALAQIRIERAKRFIKKSKEVDKPFLAYLATNAPHGPMHAPEDSAAAYQGVGNVGLQHFFGMIANIDDNVGKLRAFLDEENLTDNTIFIFTKNIGKLGKPFRNPVSLTIAFCHLTHFIAHFK